jgi:hypothetical protein
MLRVITGGEYKRGLMFLSFIVEICISVEQVSYEMLYSKLKKKIKRSLSKILGAMAFWLQIFVEPCLTLCSAAVAKVGTVH